MKISSSAWKNVDAQCHSDKLRKREDSVNSREWKRKTARRFQKIKIKTNKTKKTNKGFK
jgi:hypothetical protein